MRTNMRSIPYALLTLLCAGSLAAADVHRWVDEDGVVHYGDQPPETAQTEELHIIPPPSDSPAALQASARPQPQSGTAASGTEAAPGDEDAALRDETAELIRQRQCDVARRTRTQYQGAGYLFQTGADGTQHRLTDEERAAALAAADQDVANFCGND